MVSPHRLSMYPFTANCIHMSSWQASFAWLVTPEQNPPQFRPSVPPVGGPSERVRADLFSAPEDQLCLRRAPPMLPLHAGWQGNLTCRETRPRLVRVSSACCRRPREIRFASREKPSKGFPTEQTFRDIAAHGPLENIEPQNAPERTLR